MTLSDPNLEFKVTILVNQQIKLELKNSPPPLKIYCCYTFVCAAYA